MYTTRKGHITGVSYLVWCITEGFLEEVMFGVQQQNGPRKLSKPG